jgi:DNA-binding YbaB/EbfC family protein
MSLYEIGSFTIYSSDAKKKKKNMFLVFTFFEKSGSITYDFFWKNMFQQMKDLYKMQKQAKQMKKMLKTIQIEAEEDGILVVVNASQEVVSIEISPEILAPENKTRIEKAIMSALQRAMKKSQEVAAEKMKPMMGDMGFPGAGA